MTFSLSPGDITLLKLPTMADDIETSFQAAIDAGKIKGAIICATNSRGSFIYNKALGERTLLSGEKRAQRLDDVLCLASATKLITTVAALQCVEDELLTLTGDLSTIVPELGAKQILIGFSDDGEKPLLESQAHPITLEMLLTHSAGTSYEFIDPQLRRWCEMFTRPRDRRQAVEELFDYPLGYQPGAGWMYGPGLDWAGRAIERSTGLALGERMQQRVFDPLGITDAQFLPVTREDLRSRFVDLNPDDPDGLGRAMLGGKVDTYAYASGDFGGHGLAMTCPDYVKVLHSLLSNDGKLLKPVTVDDMFQHHLSADATAAHQAALRSPFGALFRVGIDPEVKVGHGLGGLVTLQDIDEWYGDRTLSWGGGFTLAWFIDRKTDLCAVSAIQAKLPHSRNVVDALNQTFRHDIYSKHAAWNTAADMMTEKKSSRLYPESLGH